MTKKQRRICSIFIYLLGIISSSLAQSFTTHHPTYNFKNFQIVNGEFFSNYVLDLHQDKDGYIWISTFNGLFRYDGYTYQQYKANPNQTNSISGDNPTCIMADQVHGFWVAVRPNGVVLSGGGMDYFDPAQETFTNYLLDTTQLNAPINIVNDLFWPKDQAFFWVATNAGLVQYFPETQQKKIFQIGGELNANQPIYNILETSNGVLWVGTGNGVYIFKDGQFLEKAIFAEKDCRVNSLLFKEENNLLVGTRCGLFNYDLQTGVKTLISFDRKATPSNKNGINQPRYLNNIKVLKKDQAGNIWVGNQIGLYQLAAENNRLVNQSANIRLNEDYLVNRVNAILQDQSGTLWIGKSNGLSKVYLLQNKIQQYQLLNTAQSLKDALPKMQSFNLNGSLRNKDYTVKAIFSNTADLVWVGTSFGLFQFDEKTGQFYQDHWLFEKVPALKTRNITAILIDAANNFWIGSNNYYQHPEVALDHRLYNISQKSATVNTFSSTSSMDQLPWGAIKSLVEDKAGNIWIATARGLSLYDAGTQALRSFQAIADDSTSLSSNRVRHLFQDQQARIWVGTVDAGLNLYDPKSQQFRQFRPNPASKNSISNARINTISQSTDGTIWVGTELGINAIHPDSLTVRPYFFEGYDNKIRGILEKSPGELMISTNAQILSYSVDNQLVNSYSIEDGFNEDRFISAAYFKQENATLYFGGIKGLYQIPEDALQKDQFVPPLVHTQFSIKNEPVAQSEFKKGYSQNSPLQLKPTQNDLTIRFAVLEYKEKAVKKYRYLLEGLHEEWQGIGTKNELSFFNLQPRDYVLRIAGSNADGVFNAQAAPIYFTVLPYWYWTWWAKLSYFLLFFGLLYGLYRFQLNRKLLLAETQRIQDMEQLKTRLYTNITHEFRTPLTIIQGMANRITLKRFAKEKELINRNSQNLLHLVNQLLDMSKLSSGDIPVQLSQGDIIQYLQYLLELFQPLAKDKGLSLSLETSLVTWEMAFDKEKLRQIVSNLLSNALKFTPKDGWVKLIIDKRSDILVDNDSE